MKLWHILAVGVLWALVCAAFWGTVVYVVAHFIGKFW